GWPRTPRRSSRSRPLPCRRSPSLRSALSRARPADLPMPRTTAIWRCRSSDSAGTRRRSSCQSRRAFLPGRRLGLPS
ncbi:MAG: hypothetical protein AVDCRST_MAG42-1953, partial [uncultured Chthoniobacterales bacterium]